jgi:hypothetical protein
MMLYTTSRAGIQAILIIGGDLRALFFDFSYLLTADEHQR